MKILVDKDIPYAKILFSRLGRVETVTGQAIPATSIACADALIVRSVTRVDNILLNGSRIKFVATATSGIDHIDQAWLVQAGIHFSSAPGCNAIAVAEYVFSTLLWLAQRDNFNLNEKIIGIVGVGNIGSCLQNRLNTFGVRTLLCDPLLAEAGMPGDWHSLETLVKKVDILTLHTPLTRTGKHATWHLVNEQLLSSLQDQCILINTCRSEVIDNSALLRILKGGKPLHVVLDVWESVPSLSLLSYVDISTPHIAGYTLEGKIRGATQVFNAYSEFLGNQARVNPESLLPSSSVERIRLNGSNIDESKLRLLVHLVHDIHRDDIRLRHFIKLSNKFDDCRKTYHPRREWSSICVETNDLASSKKLIKLGFNGVYTS